MSHYLSHQSELLENLRDTLKLMESTLVEQFGDTTAQQISDRVLSEFKALIPEIPYIEGRRAKLLNFFLLVTAQEVAAFRALEQFGQTPPQAWELCHKALRLSTQKIPKWKLWILQKLMFSKPIHWLMEHRGKRGHTEIFGDFEIEYLSSDGEDFELGVNYHKCANYKFAMEHGAEAFAPYICMSDVALSDAFGWGLKRTQTLADGCTHCDFRMRKGAPTQLSSRTPEVQQTIDKIAANEHLEQIV